MRLLDLVVGRTARLAARYMAAGFVHGVLNSDNINVTGESFDYGPWRFAPIWDAGFTAAYFDENGRPMLGSGQVRDPQFQDRVVAETRALLATVQPGRTS